MPDYTTQFSFKVLCSSLISREWLIEELEKRCETSGYGIVRDDEGCDLLITSGDEGYGEPMGVGQAIANYQIKFCIRTPITFEWSVSCSSLNPDSFGGGAALIHDGRFDFFTTGEWVREKMGQIGY